ncbi:hypothetical protein WDV93_16540 [Pantoea ananatis]
MTDALVALNWPVISKTMTESLFIGVLTVVLLLVNALVTQYLTLRWRTWMTARFLERWTEHPAYYQLERDNVITNSDQRVAGGHSSFYRCEMINLSVNIIGMTVDMITFTIGGCGD